MGGKFTPEAINRIEAAVPLDCDATALDVWKASGGLSHQHVKNGLKLLVERGRLLRTQEEFKPHAKSRVLTRYRYQRVRA